MPSVQIIQLTLDAIQALGRGDLGAAQALAPVRLSPWLVNEELRGVWERRALKLATAPEDVAWSIGVLWDETIGTAVGAGGLHAPPDADGMVSAGYTVEPGYRRRGYARETLRVLIARAAAEPSVRVLRLAILPTNEPSLALARQFPFAKPGERWHEKNGRELLFDMVVA
ncbi:GNAT family N-acetyltransferase [Nocardioides sp. Iso805N]|uniref:GNAT family N-acetyltransferase n=1 Tax=Nocardioides sp. Iso805N TaxID=1283287 RepID=UPI00056068E7|nr:GNAT family N-acetyltransferase [Nocardioides sp. Iso805N]